MKFKTSITNINNGEEIIRGYKLEELMQQKSFAEVVYLILKGNLPEEKEARMFNAILTSAIDHGPGTASALTARIVASAKNSVNTAVAAGVLAMGELHGGATGDAGKFFQENINIPDVAELVKGLKEKKVRIPGYGHATLTHDHRSDTLFTIAKETAIYGKHSAFAEAVFEQLKLVSSKPLPLNVDGAIAAILSDMGFDYKIMKGIFIIARVPGLVAQVYEEMKGDAGLRRLSEDDIEYMGEPPKHPTTL